MQPANDLFDAYQRAENLIEQGHLAQAADLCKEMLDANPDYAYGYHLMASLFSATGVFERALTFAQLATQMSPDVCAFHLQKGHVLYALGEYEGAALAFTAAYNLEPKNPVILLLLANTFTRRNQFREAQGLFMKARSLSDIPEIDEQEGLCQLLQGNRQNAEFLFDRLIERSPEYPWGHIHKGRLLMDGRHNTQAEACMARALKLAPTLYEPIYAMAVLNDWQGQAEIAIRYAMEAIRSRPMAWECHIYLGSLLMKDRHYPEAEQALRQALSLRPQDAYALQLFINCMQAQGRSLEAASYISQLMAGQPDHTLLRHAHALASGLQPSAAPHVYVASYYDGYSEQYEHYQRNVLCAKGPAQLAQAIRQCRHLSPPPRRLLDVGCGTGLTAEALGELADYRAGVDISPRMLERARHKQLYNALFLQEAVSFMMENREAFDMVTAAGLLSCFGELAPFIQAARNVLAPNGILAFTLERDESVPTFRIQPSGRYVHNPEHVITLLQSKGYTLLHQEDFTLLLENHTPVSGMVLLAKKAQTH